MNEVNAWLFTLESGERVVLVSDLVKDRVWMEDESNTEGFTPWMFVYHYDATLLKESEYPDYPVIIEGRPVLGRSRVNMKHVVVVNYERLKMEGSLEDLR